MMSDAFDLWFVCRTCHTQTYVGMAECHQWTRALLAKTVDEFDALARPHDLLHPHNLLLRMAIARHEGHDTFVFSSGSAYIDDDGDLIIDTDDVKERAAIDFAHYASEPLHRLKRAA